MEDDRTYSKTMCLIQVHITDLSVPTVNSVCLSLCSSNRQWSIVTGRVSLRLNRDHRGDDDIEVSRIKILQETHETIRTLQSITYSLVQYVLNNMDTANCYGQNHTKRLYIHWYSQLVSGNKERQLISYLIHMQHFQCS